MRSAYTIADRCKTMTRTKTLAHCNAADRFFVALRRSKKPRRLNPNPPDAERVRSIMIDCRASCMRERSFADNTPMLIAGPEGQPSRRRSCFSKFRCPLPRVATPIVPPSGRPWTNAWERPRFGMDCASVSKGTRLMADQWWLLGCKCAFMAPTKRSSG